MTAEIDTKRLGASGDRTGQWLGDADATQPGAYGKLVCGPGQTMVIESGQIREVWVTNWDSRNAVTYDGDKLILASDAMPINEFFGCRLGGHPMAVIKQADGSLAFYGFTEPFWRSFWRWIRGSHGWGDTRSEQ